MRNYRTYYRLRLLFSLDKPTTTKETFGVTHFPMFDIKAPNLESVYRSMQGENWSPEGEGRPFVEAAGVHHTSMSVGDVIEDLDSGKLYQVDPVGFSEVLI